MLSDNLTLQFNKFLEKANSLGKNEVLVFPQGSASIFSKTPKSLKKYTDKIAYELHKKYIHHCWDAILNRLSTSTEVFGSNKTLSPVHLGTLNN